MDVLLELYKPTTDDRLLFQSDCSTHTLSVFLDQSKLAIFAPLGLVLGQAISPTATKCNPNCRLAFFSSFLRRDLPVKTSVLRHKPRHPPRPLTIRVCRVQILSFCHGGRSRGLGGESIGKPTFNWRSLRKACPPSKASFLTTSHISDFSDQYPRRPPPDDWHFICNLCDHQAYGQDGFQSAAERERSAQLYSASEADSYVQ